MFKFVKTLSYGTNLLFKNFNKLLFVKSCIVKYQTQLCSTTTQRRNLNVRDYLKRINYNGTAQPNLENLSALSQIHKENVPYTNVEFVNGTRKILDIEILYKKIVEDQSGGVCHEINGLFIWLLRKLGYDVLHYSAKFFIDTTNEWSEWTGHSFPFVSIYWY